MNKRHVPENWDHRIANLIWNVGGFVVEIFVVVIVALVAILALFNDKK